MSTLAAVNETLGEIKGQLVRNNSKLDGLRGVKPIPSGPKDLTERERTGQTSGEAAREGLKERAGAKPTGTGVGGLIDKAPNLPISTGNKLLDYSALLGLIVAFRKQIADFLKGFFTGITKAFEEEIAAFKELVAGYTRDIEKSLITGTTAGFLTAQKRFNNLLDKAQTRFNSAINQRNVEVELEKTKTPKGGVPGEPIPDGRRTPKGGMGGVDDIGPNAGRQPAAGGRGRGPTRAQMLEEIKSRPQNLPKGYSTKGGGVSFKGKQIKNPELEKFAPKSVAAAKAAVPKAAPNAAPVEKFDQVKPTKNTAGQKEVNRALTKLKQLQRITGTNSKLGKAGVLLSGFFAALESLTILQDPTASLEEKREALIETAAGLLTGTIAGLVGASIGAGVLTAITGGIAAPVTIFLGSVGGGILGYFGGDMVGRAGAELLVRFLLSDTPVDPAGMINRLSAAAKTLKDKVGIDAKQINKGINSAIDAINPFSSTPSKQTSGYKPSPSRINRDLPGQATNRRRRGLGLTTVNNPPQSTTVSGSGGDRSIIGSTGSDNLMGADALEGSTPSVSASGPAPSGQRIAAAATTQKAAMVNQAARQQAAGGGNNITINKGGDTTLNQEGGGGGGTSTPVVVVKSDGDMPKIGAKIAYGMGL
jgi:hypothetical protein